MDKCREEFEGYMLKSGYPRDVLSKSNHYDCYHDVTIDAMYSAWKSAWKVSRESMKAIKLPDATFETPSGDSALREEAVIDAITLAGYKVVQK